MNPIGNSDHISLLISIRTDPYRERRHCRQVWRSYGKADWERLRAFLADAPWHRILDNSPAKACEGLTKRILYGMQQFIPSKKLITRPSDPSWWTPECTAAVRAKQTAWKRWRKNPDSANQEAYNTASSNSTTCLSHAKAQETARIRRRLSSGSLQSKEWLSSVKKAGGVGRHGGIPVIRDDQGNEFETSEEIAECFGRFFAKKCCLDDGDFNATDIPRFPSRCSSTLCRIRFRPSTVRRLLGQLDPAKATRPDGVPARVLKECRAVLVTPLPTYSHYASSRVSIPQTGKLLTWSRYTNASHEQT